MPGIIGDQDSPFLILGSTWPRYTVSKRGNRNASCSEQGSSTAAECWRALTKMLILWQNSDASARALLYVSTYCKSNCCGTFPLAGVSAVWMDHSSVLVLWEIGKLRNWTDWTGVWFEEVAAVGDIGNRGLIWQFLLELAQPCMTATCKYSKTSKHSYLYQCYGIFDNFDKILCFIHSFLCNLFHWGNVVMIPKSRILCAFQLFQWEMKWLMVAKKWILSAWVKLVGAQLLYH